MSVRSILKGIRSILIEPRCKPVHPAFKYGMLVAILVLCAWAIRIHIVYDTNSNGDPYLLDVVVILLLLNHLSDSFKWRRGVAVALRICSCLWIVFTFFYLLCLSPVLYP